MTSLKCCYVRVLPNICTRDVNVILEEMGSVLYTFPRLYSFTPEEHPIHESEYIGDGIHHHNIQGKLGNSSASNIMTDLV